ncbi:rab-GTPase-TBC domain-containing protein [Fennellomyces sp. T-0311]|nr:rab-GTPase-TBC domain-containing protein [Fennellomyces sp. T-0311]
MFILAQIERQNALLEKDPKSISLQANELKAQLSTVQQLKQQQDDDIWEAVIQDFDRVAMMTPHLLSVKLRAGIPPRVRGVCWQAMCKSASLHLETVYGQLCNEQSPHERIIQRDLARTFPCIDMFKQENGAGQLAMRRVLEAYSLYDSEVGYCQGLAFLVGPLLMNMPEVQAFCVFVRLMETYEMRPMFTLNMAGLQLRLYQFTSLLNELLPDLAKHMNKHGVHAAMYASQWFLTLFAYVFPISLVQRIYDIVFAEGAAETIMRVAIAMLRRSQDKILQETEFEDLLDHVTSRKLCEPYADDTQVIDDATSLSSVITRAKMDSLADQYNNNDKQSKFWKRKVKRSPSTSSTDSLKRTHSLPSTKKYVSLETHEQEIQKLSWTLAQLNTKHQQTINQLVELKMDMQDVESERDALKMTIMQVEKSKRYYALSVSSSSCNSIVSSQTEFAFSDSTTMTSDDSNDEDLRTELVRLKVENFELQQQCEKLTHEHEDMHVRLDMVNDGQMALVDQLITTKADMDELMKEKKQKDMEWLEASNENSQLKEQLSQLKSKLSQLMMDHTQMVRQDVTNRQPQEQPQQQRLIRRRRSTDDTCIDQAGAELSDMFHIMRIRELERALAEAKIRLVEYESNHQDHPLLVDKKRSASVDIRPVTRSSSIYGRVWHAITPRSSTVDK